MTWPLRVCHKFLSTSFEIQKAVQLLFSGKASGSDYTLAEINNIVGTALTEKLHQLMWQQEKVLQEFKGASIIHLYKWKGNCDNHWDTYMLSIGGKILARILLNHLTSDLDQGLLTEIQWGFLKDHGTNEMVLTQKQLQDTLSAENRTLACSAPLLTWPKPLTLLVGMSYWR